MRGVQKGGEEEMTAFNQCNFLGFVGNQPELKKTEAEKPYCHFRLAVHDKKDEPLWFTVTTWSKLAEQVHTCVQKGAKVLVSGRLQVRQYRDKDNVERTSIEVIAETVRFLDAKSQAERQEGQDAPAVAA
jgi:single-strand DNA-binding protein